MSISYIQELFIDRLLRRAMACLILHEYSNQSSSQSEYFILSKMCVDLAEEIFNRGVK